MQWHPLFAELVRPLLQRWYDVRTNLAVGDVPRSADLVLLRRSGRSHPPFRGLWRWLTAWNVVEFKGPTVSARVADLDLLVELGLGIHRRLNEEPRERGQPRVGRADVSYWYLANHLGRRFLRDARELLGQLEQLGAGVWQVPHVGRRLILVSSRDVPVDRDSIPLHLLVREPVAATRALAEEVVTQADLWPVYGGWLALRFPDLWQEVCEMARRSGRPFFDFSALVDEVGLAEFIRQLGLKRVIDEVGPKRVVNELGIDAFLAELTPEQRRELKARLKSS